MSAKTHREGTMKRGNISIQAVKMSLIAFIFLLAGSVVFAAPTKQLSYQGRLNNASGQPVPDGTYSIVFSIYNVASGGSPLWTETQNVSVANGGFSVYLGSVTALTLPFNEDYFLGLKVASDAEMTPRLKLSVVGASAYSLEAEKLQGKAASDFALATHTHTGLSATTVNGFSASATPSANTLLPLDSSAKFPTSVLNVGTTTGTIAAGDHTHAASGVTQIVAGTNVTVSPAGGTGVVTINATPATGFVQLTPSSSQTIQPTGDVVPLIIKDDAGTTADLFDVQNNVGTSLVKVNGAGNLILGTPTFTSAKLAVSESGTTNIAGRFEITNTSNSQAAIRGETFGNGYGVVGVAASSGTGSGVYGAAFNTTGNSGFFATSNFSNTAAVILANTAGTGNLLQLQTGGTDKFIVNNAGNTLIGNPVITTAKISSYQTGTGDAGVFEINNGTSSNSSVQGKTNGTGTAGYFEITNASNSNPAINSRTNGSGAAVYGYNSGSGDSIFASTTGTSTGNLFFGNHVGSSGNLIQLQSGGADQFVVAKSGKLTFSTGANKAVGAGTIAAATNSITIANTSVTASSLIFLTINNTTGSVPMPLKVGTITPGVSFVVDTGDATGAPAGGINFNYMIVN